MLFALEYKHSHQKFLLRILKTQLHQSSSFQIIYDIEKPDWND